MDFIWQINEVYIVRKNIINKQSSKNLRFHPWIVTKICNKENEFCPKLTNQFVF